MPAWVKGQSGNPKGKPKGAKNRTTLLTEEQRIALAKRMGIDPLQFLLSILRDPAAPIEHKIEAAKVAAPYMHRKMPLAVETTVSTDELVRQVREVIGGLFLTTTVEARNSKEN